MMLEEVVDAPVFINAPSGRFTPAMMRHNNQSRIVAHGGGIEVSMHHFGARKPSFHLSTRGSIAASRAPRSYWNRSFLVGPLTTQYVPVRQLCSRTSALVLGRRPHDSLS